jgi:hypothetical protein
MIARPHPGEQIRTSRHRHPSAPPGAAFSSIVVGASAHAPGQSQSRLADPMDVIARSPATKQSYELEPRKGVVRFFRTFFVLHCLLFHLAPSPEAEGTSGKGGFPVFDAPTAAGLRSYSYSSLGRHTRLPAAESSYSLQTPSGEPAALLRSGYSRNQASHWIDPLTRFGCSSDSPLAPPALSWARPTLH